MLFLKQSFLALVAILSILASSQSATAGLVVAYEFNTAGVLDGFTGNNVTGLTADGDSLNGTANGNDPQLLRSFAAGPLLPTAGQTWTTLEFRVREVRLSPHGSTAAKGAEATTADELDFNGTGVIVGRGAGPVINSGFSGTALDLDGFSVVTVDISSFGSNTFSSLRLDPIGGAWSNSNSETNGNSFEIDYIRVFDSFIAVPEPTSFAMFGIGCLGLAFRRRSRN